MDDPNDRRTEDETRAPQGEPASPPRRRHRPWIWACALLLPVVFAVAWWNHGYGSPAEASRRQVPPAPAVVAAAARKGDIDITLDELGTVTPLATVTVQTQISGQLTQVAF